MRCAFAILLVVLGGWAGSQFVSGTFSIVVGAQRPADQPVAGPCCIYYVTNYRGAVSLLRTPLEDRATSGQPVPRWRRYPVGPDPLFERPAWNDDADVMAGMWALVVPFWLLALPPGAAVAWALWRRWRARKPPPGFPVVA